MIFKNIYVLAVTGASLITSTSIWLFTNSEVQKTLDSGDVKNPGVVAGSKDTTPTTKEQAPKVPAAKPSKPAADPKPVPAAPKEGETSTGKGSTPTTEGTAQSKPAPSQPAQPKKTQGDVTLVTVTVPQGGKDAKMPNMNDVLGNGVVITGGSKK